MTIRPIIFSEPMVKALLAGHKTQTRRLGTSPLRNCEVGDLLYVREAFAKCGSHAYNAEDMVRHSDDTGVWGAIHRAGWDRSPPSGGWKPSIHMPRWASRLTLKVTRVRIDRLQAISKQDCRDEGHPYCPDVSSNPDVHLDAAHDWFMDLWDTLHTKPGERWEDNPFVVALSFDVIRGNVDNTK